MGNFTNNYDLPEPVVKVLTEDDYDKGHSNRSITTLIDSPRVRILKSEHKDQMDQDVSEMLWSVLGRAAHKLFEGAAGASLNHISEQRLYVERQGWTISGAIDLQELLPDGTVAVDDYKVASVWSIVFDKQEWHNQLNAYAWLIRHATGKRVSRARIIAILRDWKNRDARYKHDYPPSPITTVHIPLWTDYKQDEYMEGRIQVHQQAEFERLTGGALPHCTDIERWARAPSYAVKKGSNKRAVRVLTSMQAARDYIKQNELDDKHYVETRPGENVRCEQDWCQVAEYCSQWQQIKKLQELEA